jgi:hypothetical protein
MNILRNVDIIRSDDDVIKELQELGIRVINIPMALVDDTLVSPSLFGEKSNGSVVMDIREALEKIKIRKSIIGDPFS